VTDREKLLSIASFLHNEGIRVEDSYKILLTHKTVKYRECDALDYLELIQHRDRWEYFAELDAVISSILYDKHVPRPPWWPLR